MPKSRHRRKGETRPRPKNVNPPPPNPEPSPTWVPATGAALLGLGVIVILVGYLDPVARVTSGWPGLGSNWPLVLGFVFLAGGFGFLTRWQ